MIAPRRSRLLCALFGWEARRRLRAAFGRVLIAGRDQLEAALAAGPVLLISNHTSFYDAILAMHMGHNWGAFDGACMMDADNLRQRPFLGRIGAFGVERGEADAEALRYAEAHLSGPRKLTWIFPQGDERPVDERPLGFRRGAAVVAANAPHAQVIPLGLRYAFGSGPKPDAWLSFGPPIPAAEGVEVIRAAQERAVEAELERIRAALGGQREGFEVSLRGKRGWMAMLAEWSLIQLTRLRRSAARR